ncbi:scarecrow-like protein 8 [Tanacetum coccineum]
MSYGFSGEFSGGYSGGFSRSPLAGLVGKRSLAEFQQHQNHHQLYLRNVKPRSSDSNLSSVSRRDGFYSGVMSNYQINNFITRKNENEKKMMNRLQEIEKELLLDEDENDDVSGVTDAAWDETIQSILNPVHVKKPGSSSPSPTTSSSSSSCASSSINVSTKQLVSDAAEAISDGKSELASELITRLNKVCCSSACGNPEQKVGFQMASALLARVRVAPTANEIYSKEHIMSTQLLYDKSPCFKLCFMAANSVIMKTFSDSDSGSGRDTGNIHVVDFDIGHGLQYVYLLHEIAAARKGDARVPSALKVTTFKDFGNGGVERLKLVGDGLKTLANKLGVLFYVFL